MAPVNIHSDFGAPTPQKICHAFHFFPILALQIAEKRDVKGKGERESYAQLNAEFQTDFIFWGSKITADCDCSHEIKRCLLLGKKAMTNLDSI